MNELRSIDLNLLVVLDALLREVHVGRTADQLNMSQPAVSNALSRLRGVFDDALLVRSGMGMRLTPRAERLKTPVRRAIDAVQAAIEPPTFDCSTSDRTFRLAMSDYGAASVLPSILPKLRSLAPGVTLDVIQGSRDWMAGALLKGDIDMAIGVFPNLPKGLQQTTLISERFACLVDVSNSALDGDKLSLEGYLNAPHIHVSLMPGDIEEVDVALNSIRRRRRIAVTLPHYRVAPALIRGTDLILTLARKGLDDIELEGSLLVCEPPFQIPTFDVVLLWHEQQNTDLGAHWLRGLMQSKLK